jgi:hypothetical protein
MLAALVDWQTSPLGINFEENEIDELTAGRSGFA